MNNKNIVLIILLIVIAGSIYYLNSQKASPGDFEPDEQLKQTEDVDIEKQTEEIPRSAVTVNDTFDKTLCSKTPTKENITLNPKTKNTLLMKTVHCFATFNQLIIF